MADTPVTEPVLDADLKVLFNSEDATVGNKLQAIAIQAQRDELKRVAAASSEGLLAKEEKRDIMMTCVIMASDLRRQNMNTATSAATEEDIIKDIDRMSKTLYSQTTAALALL